MPLSDFPYLGFGVGLRHTHFEIFQNKKYQTVQWVEALTENYLPWEDAKPRRPLNTLIQIRKNLPVAFHGVSLSIGSIDELDQAYLKRLKNFIHQVEPAWVSDHLCWTGIHGTNLHDLLPLPYTEEAVRHIVKKVEQTQEFLGRRILLENVSSYAEFAESEMKEWEFLAEVAKRSDCGILFDVNNIYVSSVNHGFDPQDYIDGIPKERVGQIHLAGHTNKGTHLIDTHDEPVCDAVWELYERVAREFGEISTMVEWDDSIPEWPVLEEEVAKAQRLFERVQREERRDRSKRTAEIPATL